MLDIEQNLKNDSTGEYKKDVLDKLSKTTLEVRNELNKGLSPDEYTRLNYLLHALETSMKIVDQY